MNSIFELSMWCYQKARRRNKDDYQRFSLMLNRRSFFANVENAESIIPSWIRDIRNHPFQDDVYCFKLIEYPIGETLLCSDDNLSVRIYDYEGHLLDERLYPTVSLSETWKSDYHGRSEDKIKYKPGDVVEYAGGLYVIARFMTPLSEKDWIMADETDDGYLAYLVDENADNIQNDNEGNILLNHRHPQCTDLFPPRFPISKKIKIRIDNLRKILRVENNFEE